MTRFELTNFAVLEFYLWVPLTGLVLVHVESRVVMVVSHQWYFRQIGLFFPLLRIRIGAYEAAFDKTLLATCLRVVELRKLLCIVVLVIVEFCDTFLALHDVVNVFHVLQRLCLCHF